MRRLVRRLFTSYLERRNKVSLARRLAGLLFLFLLTLILIPIVGGQLGRYKVISNSMQPVLNKGDFVLVDQRPDFYPERGDIIVFEDPENVGDLLTKRVIGLPGEYIQFNEDDVIVDGRHYEVEGWEEPVTRNEATSLKLAEDEIFVMGDNRLVSYDSLYFGAVRLNRVYGRIFLIYWPPDRASRVEPVPTIHAKEAPADIE